MYDELYAVFINDILCVYSVENTENKAIERYLDSLGMSKTNISWIIQKNKGAVVKEITISVV